MLRPERMSRVSVTGSKRVMSDAVDAIHGLNLLDVTDYDGAWDGFTPGNPESGADEVAEKLVTIRSIESILNVDESDANATQMVVDDDLDELDEVRRDVNDLDDRRNELEEGLRRTEERIDTAERFAALGIDVDLFAGYDALDVAVGEGNAAAVEDALADDPDVEAYEVFREDDVVAAFAYPAENVDLDDVLVGAEFAAFEIPDATGDPEEYLSELQHRRRQLESKLDTVEDELEDLKLEVAGFLLAAEEELSIEVQKREAPLSFATTENAFVAEGWLPTERFVDLVEELDASFGDHVEVEELERASYDGEGRLVDREEVGTGESGDVTPTAADGGQQVRSDGGVETPMSDGEPPVVQENPDPVEPFELFVQLVDRPKYSELDPSVILFLTFPLFYGFMIGDLGYGILYTAIGYAIVRHFEDDVMRSFGAIAMWSGGFTMLFGVLYGEILGLHTITDVLWVGVVGLEHAPIEKGLSPAGVDFARLWIVLSLVAGVFHVAAGYVFDFAENLQHHGFADAVYESGSWLLLMVGVWTWIFSRAARSAKPEFVFTVFDGQPFAFGLPGLPPTVGWVGLAIGLGLGLPLMIRGEIAHLGSVGVGMFAGALESLQVLVNVLSYVRLAAVLLAKAGMAFVVNLLFFGAYNHHGEFHFLIGTDSGTIIETTEITREMVMFPGLVHMGVVGVLFGVVVFILGHLLVLGLGVTSAGLQALRLEYVEFLSKYYEGGGDEYRPLGYVRRYTAEE